MSGLPMRQTNAEEQRLAKRFQAGSCPNQTRLAKVKMLMYIDNSITRMIFVNGDIAGRWPVMISIDGSRGP